MQTNEFFFISNVARILRARVCVSAVCVFIGVYSGGSSIVVVGTISSTLHNIKSTKTTEPQTNQIKHKIEKLSALMKQSANVLTVEIAFLSSSQFFSVSHFVFILFLNIHLCYYAIQ